MRTSWPNNSYLICAEESQFLLLQGLTGFFKRTEKERCF